MRAVRQQERSQATLTRELERDAKRQHLEDQIEAAADRNAALDATIDELDTILVDIVENDWRLDFSSLRVSEEYPSFIVPTELNRAAVEPKRDWFTTDIKPPGALARLFPGAVERYQERLQVAASKFEQAHAEYRSAVEKRISAVQNARTGYERNRDATIAKAKERNAEVTEFERSYRAGAPQAVIASCTLVLERSEYPPNFPQGFRLAYQPASREVIVDYQLPAVTLVPKAAEVRYIKSKDTFEEKPRKPSEIRERYQKIVASTALRTIHELLQVTKGTISML